MRANCRRLPFVICLIPPLLAALLIARALPPNHADQVGKPVFRLLDLYGKTIGEFEGKREVFEPAGSFERLVASWPSDLALPGAHHLLGIAYGKDGKELARVAPRLVSVNMTPGY